MADTTKPKKAPAKPRKTTAKAKPVATETDPVTAQPAAANGKPVAPEKGHRSVSSEEVARLAHQFWTERGGQHGKHEEDWYRAEQELRKRAS